MSKAFVRESDNEPDPPPFQPRGPAAGSKIRLTAQGQRRLQEELTTLSEGERPRLTARGDDPDAKRELQALNRRIGHLQQTLATAEVVPPPPGNEDRVLFGATVTVRSGDASESSYRLVGDEESDPAQGWLSWQSPLARALLNHRPGDRVEFATPSGKAELQIVGVRYL